MNDEAEIDIVVNGQARRVPVDATVESLLALLELHGDGLAIAVDRTIVPRSERAHHVLVSGSQVEILRAVGGG